MSFNRYRASALHLGVSVFVGLCVAAIVFLGWYPGSLAAACGVAAIFLMMLGVDVVLGPCLTLIVFNPAKKSLPFDMAFIVLVQLGALLYGMHAVFVARPAYAVFNVDRFDLVLANDLSPEKLAKVKDPAFRHLPWVRPKVVAAQRPSSGKERSQILLQALAGGDDLPQLPQYYVPYASAKQEAISRLQPLERLRAFNPGRIGEVEALVQRYASRKGGVAYLPLRGKVKDQAAIVARDSAEVIEFVDLQPW